VTPKGGRQRGWPPANLVRAGVIVDKQKMSRIGRPVIQE
jgi:hypothetical protein